MLAPGVTPRPPTSPAARSDTIVAGERRLRRPLEHEPGSVDRIKHRTRQRRAVLALRALACHDFLELDRRAGSLHHLAGCAGNLGPDAVAGDQRDRAHGKR